MVIQLAHIASNAMLDALGSMMDGGYIELMADERVLAVLKLSDPATQQAIDGEIEFNDIAQDIARMKGSATSARIFDQTGELIMDCDVGDENSDAVIRLTSMQINRGAPVLINSFRLGMP